MTSLDNQLPLQNVNADTGKAPEKRIADAADAQNMVSELVKAGQERSRSNAQIKGQIDGNPPYSPERLRAAGQSYRANINFREAKAALSTALVPYYDLFAGATTYFNVKLDHDNPDDKEYFSGIVTEEWDRMLKSWYGFDFNVQSMLHDFVAFGKGFLIWASKTGWRFEVADQWRVLVPDSAKADVEKLEVCVYRERMRVNKLWDFIRNKKAATDAGWNIEATVNAIAKAFPENATGNEQFNYELVQQKFKDKDLTEGTRCSTVPVAHIYVKEFSGKVSHLMVVEDMPQSKAQQTFTSRAKLEFLYEGYDEYDNFQQAIAAFFLETGDGSWNGISGLGKDIYAPMALKDRAKCSLMDLVFLRCGIALQARTASALQKTGLVQAGVFNIIPPDYEVQQATIMGDTKSAVDADLYLDNVLASNTGVYKQRQMKTQGNPITAKQAEYDQMNSMVLGNSAVNRFYSSLDKLGAELYRRTCLENSGTDEEAKAARDFKKRCKDRGVPEKLLSKVEYVRAYRNIGNGSIQMRKQAIQELYPFYALLPEDGKQNYLEDVVSAIAGHSMVDRYAPRDRRQKLPNDHQAQAMLENAAIKVGAPVTWTPSQNNVIHLQTHLQAASQAAASLEQGANPMEVVAFIDGVGAHSAVHLQQIATDPTRKQETQIFTEQFQQLAAFNDKLKAQVQSQQEAAQKKAMEQMAAQQQVMSDAQLKQFEAAQDMQIKQAKAEQNMRLQEQKTAQKMAINDAIAASKISNQNQPAEVPQQ